MPYTQIIYNSKSNKGSTIILHHIQILLDDVKVVDYFDIINSICLIEWNMDSTIICRVYVWFEINLEWYDSLHILGQGK